MKIVETAVWTYNQALFEELSQRLPLDKTSVMNIDVYRFEIDDELVVLMYEFQNGVKYPPELLDHLEHHLAGLLIVTESKDALKIAETPEDVDKLAEKLVDKPTVMAVKLAPGKIAAMNGAISEDGFYLSPRGRIAFWHPDAGDSALKVWEMIWQSLQVS